MIDKPKRCGMTFNLCYWYQHHIHRHIKNHIPTASTIATTSAFFQRFFYYSWPTNKKARGCNKGWPASKSNTQTMQMYGIPERLAMSGARASQSEIGLGCFHLTVPTHSEVSWPSVTGTWLKRLATRPTGQVSPL